MIELLLPTTLAADDAQPGVTPPQLGEETTPEGPPTPGATRSRANKIVPQRADPAPALPTATGAEQTAERPGPLSRAFLESSPRLASRTPTGAPARKQPPALYAVLSDNLGVLLILNPNLSH